LEFFLRLDGPVRVPIEHVEAFLLGQGPAWLPGKRMERAATITLVVKLSERVKEWEHVAVFPAWGSWCDHYVTIRGTWCEPLSLEVVNRLNACLTTAKQPAVLQRTSS
jgi:hypothetical protein